MISSNSVIVCMCDYQKILTCTHVLIKNCILLKQVSYNYALSENNFLCQEYKDSTVNAHDICSECCALKRQNCIVFQHIHNNLGHFGIKKAFDQVYWPDHECDVDSCVKKCEKCQKRNPADRSSSVSGNSLSHRPFCDIIMGYNGATSYLITR